MRQVILRQGEALVEDVPAPFIEVGTVLVAVDHSCISIGTEMSGLRTGGLPLWKRALRQPENVKKAIASAMTVGPRRTWSLVNGQLAAGSATGYSAAGVVLEVGDGVADLAPGDRVACAGALYAHHAEVIRVPRNLVAPVPEGVSLRDASTVTLGAIAMQGVRRATPTLGETFVVIGLGILGQLTAQLLRANGCRVIGTDLDSARVALAEAAGMDVGILADDEAPSDQVARLTDGLGADGVIITAATPSDAVISTAFQMCRKKGRVVLVGDVGLSLKRSDFYAKELDLFISSSYGPGRYDRRYEEKGLDYPAAYVRWTENRNMGEYLRLLEDKRVRLDHLIDAVYPVEQAGEAYRQLKGGGENTPIMVLMSYDRVEAVPTIRRVTLRAPALRAGSRVRVGLIGAGGFAKGMHLPNLRQLGDLFELRAVASRTGHNAVATARQFEAAYATSDYREIIADPEVDAVIVATRHDLHATIARAAMQAGKHVLLEKPLCTTQDELEILKEWVTNATATQVRLPILLTGFNRRFSRYGVFARELARTRSAPVILTYRMNAGFLPSDHWTHGQEGGGRNVGEACHLYDLATAITGAACVDVQATSIRSRGGHYSDSDNFAATCRFDDGSVFNLVYTALGHRDHSKEQFELFVDGKVLTMDDYRSMRLVGSRRTVPATNLAEKGQREELVAFGKAIRDGGEWPIPWWEQVQAMEMAFRVERSLLVSR